MSNYDSRNIPSVSSSGVLAGLVLMILGVLAIWGSVALGDYFKETHRVGAGYALMTFSLLGLGGVLLFLPLKLRMDKFR